MKIQKTDLEDLFHYLTSLCNDLSIFFVCFESILLVEDLTSIYRNILISQNVILKNRINLNFALAHVLLRFSWLIPS